MLNPTDSYLFNYISINQYIQIDLIKTYKDTIEIIDDNLQKTINNNQCYSLIKNSLLLNLLNYYSWNLYGILSNNIYIKQHAFIRSIQIYQTPEAYNNLALTYNNNIFRIMNNDNESELIKQIYDTSRIKQYDLSGHWEGLVYHENLKENYDDEEVY